MVANPTQGHDNPLHDPVIDTFKLVAETRKMAKEISESARDAVKAFYRSPDSLASFIERHQTPVYMLKGRLICGLVLAILGYEPGFIAPAEGRRYRLLERFLRMYNAKPHCEFKHGVFVLTRPLFTVGFISHQLHHWLAYRSGMAGYSDKSQLLYKKFWNENNGVIGQEVYKMKVEDMVALKAAINRDLEALLFLKEIANEVLIPAKQARRISHGTASA